jgi:hypothetical protein
VQKHALRLPLARPIKRIGIKPAKGCTSRSSILLLVWWPTIDEISVKRYRFVKLHRHFGRELAHWEASTHYLGIVRSESSSVSQASPMPKLSAQHLICERQLPQPSADLRSRVHTWPSLPRINPTIHSYSCCLIPWNRLSE